MASLRIYHDGCAYSSIHINKKIFSKEDHDEVLNKQERCFSGKRSHNVSYELNSGFLLGKLPTDANRSCLFLFSCSFCSNKLSSST